MRKILLSLGFIVLTPIHQVAAQPAASRGDGETTSRIEAITFSSGGLAAIHRSARLTGSETVGLEVPLDHVDDILKSLLVRDPAGAVSSVTLDGLSPVDETFRRLPFTPATMRSLAGLADSLQGVLVRATSGGRTVEGMVMGVDTGGTGTSEANDNGSARTHVLSVMTGSGSIEVLRLGADATLDILDEAMRRMVRQAAEVSGRGRIDDVRSIGLSLTGEGAREIGISYVVPAPVWKTSYRLIMEGETSGRLQAWAVLENATGDDWDDVAITLSSGAPVTLKQRLHARYWHDRPELAVTSGSTTPPRADMSSATDVADARARGSQRAAPMKLNDGYAAGRGVAEMAAMAPIAAEPAPAPSVEAREGEIESSWRIAEPVSLAAGRTLSIPFVDSALPAERISVFQPERGSLHPVAAVMIDNEGGTTLPPGILTVYDAGRGELSGQASDGGLGSLYVGDAQLAGLPANEKRIVSFAADRKVEITTDTQPRETVEKISVADGVVRASRVWRITTTYSVRGAADAPRTIIVEHPRQNGWEFSSQSHDSSTATHHRIGAEVGAGETVELVAVDTRTQDESFSLIDADEHMLLRWSGLSLSGDGADDALAEALASLADLRTRLASAQRGVEAADEEIRRAADNQARIRDNLTAAPEGSELARRYLSMLAQDEDRIAEAGSRRDQAEAVVEGLRDELAERIRDM